MHCSSNRIRLAAPAALLACFIGTALAQPAPPGADTVRPARPRNIYTAGADVHPPGPVPRDFVAAGARIQVDQPVGGDAMLAGGSIDLRARVAEDVRAAGARIEIGDHIGGDLAAAGADLLVRPTASIGGDAELHGAAVSVAGRIAGDLKATAQTLVIDGEVRGATQVAAERLQLGPNARLLGAFTYASPAEPERAAGAIVQGPVTHDRPGAARPRAADARPGSAAGRIVAPFLARLACAVLFLWLLPGFGSAAAARLRARPGLALLAGLIVLLALPPAAVLLFMTVLGIPLALLLLAAYPVLVLAGFVVGVLAIARLLPARPGQAHAARIGSFALALAVVLLAGFVPGAGPLVLAVVALAGVGAGVLQLWGRRATAMPPPADRLAVGGGSARPA